MSVERTVTTPVAPSANRMMRASTRKSNATGTGSGGSNRPSSSAAQAASSTPSVPPITARTAPSVRSWRSSRPRPAAQRETDRHLASARAPAGEQKVREIGAADEQHQHGHAHQHREEGADRALNRRKDPWPRVPAGPSRRREAPVTSVHCRTYSPCSRPATTARRASASSAATRPGATDPPARAPGCPAIPAFRCRAPVGEPPRSGAIARARCRAWTR